MPDELRLLPADITDYAALAVVGHEAFHADKLAFGEGPDIYENPKFLQPLLARGDGTVRKLVLGEITVGVIITFEKTSFSRWLGCICLLPSCQGNGYGSQAIRLIEQAYPSVRQWGLDTPAGNLRNRRFYEQAGYQVVGQTELREGFTLLVFEKRL